MVGSKPVVPLRDDNPTRITPYVTYGIIAVNILVFLFEASLMGSPLWSNFSEPGQWFQQS